MLSEARADHTSEIFFTSLGAVVGSIPAAGPALWAVYVEGSQNALSGFDFLNSIVLAAGIAAGTVALYVGRSRARRVADLKASIRKRTSGEA